MRTDKNLVYIGSRSERKVTEDVSPLNGNDEYCGMIF